ncbi:MAG TPA: glycosyltransferase family 4 protein [Opitutaceae bacterium]|nr:glycosyltransferase family 4 protein [Opitutaceae bacterium]
MNSLLLAPELFASEGGITRILRLYLKAMSEIALPDGRVSFLSLNDSMVDESDLRRYSAGNVDQWEVCSKKKVHFVMAARRLSRRSNTLVCGHVAQLPVAWAVSLLRPSIKYYLVAHGIEVWRPFTLLERRALKGATKIFCVSEFTRQRLLENCNLRPERLVVLFNALDPYMDPVTAVPPILGDPIILAISRLTSSDNYKGIGHLIAAMPAVCEAAPNARLRIVGRGNGMPSLQSQVRKLNVSKNVEFLGYRSDEELKTEFEGCRLFALPSEKEGFGLVYLEAMAHGRPCLGARSGGVPEVITPETGILVDYGNVPQIAQAMLTGITRTWDIGLLRGRAESFSYLRFKDRLESVLKP